MDYAKLKVSEIRSMLINHGMSEDEASKIKGKANLIEALEGLIESDVEVDEEVSSVDAMGDDDIDGLLADLDEGDFEDISELLGDDEPEVLVDFETPKPVVHNENEVVPQIVSTSENEQDDIMSRFEEDELFDGKYPKAVGLRRVARQVHGEIISSGPTQVIVGQDQDGLPMATVVYEVRFQSGLVISDVAECWKGNTDPEFAIHPSASAATKAEGRAFRKLLGLSVIAAEEAADNIDPVEALRPSLLTESARNIMDEMDKDDDMISVRQASLITAKCATFGIDVEKFINKKFYLGKTDEKSFDSIEEVPYNIAAAMVKELNNYQGTHADSKEIPEEIKL